MADRPKDAGGSIQHRRTLQPNVPSPSELKPTTLPAMLSGDHLYLVHPSLVSSRVSLCRSLDALSAHRDALTIIGAHAVHEQTKHLELESTTTSDGDLAMTPALVGDDPTIESSMRSAGFTPLMEIAAARPDDPVAQRWGGRPGLWALDIGPRGPVGEVDIMVPESIAGRGRRSVRALSVHGKNATGRVPGLELAVLERDAMVIENFADGTVREAYVARPSGILCAKAYKITDRQDAVSRGRAHRGESIQKDATDLWRCMEVSTPAEVRREFERHLADEQSADAVAEGYRRLNRVLSDPAIVLTVSESVERFGVDESDVEDLFNEWCGVFSR